MYVSDIRSISDQWSHVWSLQGSALISFIGGCFMIPIWNYEQHILHFSQQLRDILIVFFQSWHLYRWADLIGYILAVTPTGLLWWSNHSIPGGEWVYGLWQWLCVHASNTRCGWVELIMGVAGIGCVLLDDEETRSGGVISNIWWQYRA